MSNIQVSREGFVQTIRFDRTDKKNALTQAMYIDINAAMEEAEANSAIRVTVFTGGPGCFTAGNDLVDFMQNPPAGNDAPVFRFLQNLLNAKKPLVAAVNGDAIGVGTTMLLHSDLVYVGDNARLQMPFVSLGLCPEAGSSYLLTRMAGYPKAAELLMLCDFFNAQTAKEIGLANEVVQGDALPRAQERAAQLAAQPPASVRLAKQFMRGALRDTTARVMAEEGMTFIQRLGSPEAREAMGAFLQKRKPDFSQFE